MSSGFKLEFKARIFISEILLPLNTGYSKNTKGINWNPLKAITPNSFSHSIMTLPFENVEYNTKFNVDVMKKWALGKIYLNGFRIDVG